MKKIYFFYIAVLVSLALAVVFGCSANAVSDFQSARVAYRDRSEAVAFLTAGIVEVEQALSIEANLSQTVSLTTAGNLWAADTASVIQPQRRLVRRADLRIRVENLERADAEITALMERFNAYSSFSNFFENHRSYTIRVPSAAYDSFLAEASGMGRILHRSESTEDVSLRFFDLEGRLASQQELLNTFRSYLGRATNIEEILAVEARLADLHNQIERTGQELRWLGDRIDYSTITLSIEGPVSADPFRGLTLGERLRGLFGGFGRFLSATMVFLTGLVIYGIPVLLILVVLFWLLFGKIGLIKKLYRIAAGKKNVPENLKRKEN